MISLRSPRERPAEYLPRDKKSLIYRRASAENARARARVPSKFSFLFFLAFHVETKMTILTGNPLIFRRDEALLPRDRDKTM